MAQAKTFGGIVRDVPTGARAHVEHGVPAARHCPPPALPYGGGPVLHSNRTHPIFWEPAGVGTDVRRRLRVARSRRSSWTSPPTAARPTNVYSLSGQYRDRSGPAAYDSTYGGAVVATDPLPPSGCSEPPTGPGWTVLPDRRPARDRARTRDRGRASPDDEPGHLLHGHAVRVRQLRPARARSSCALGGSMSRLLRLSLRRPRRGVLYAVIPYNAVPGHCQSSNPRPNASTADPTISTISHEQNETVTDPDGNAWVDAEGDEEADLCLTNFGPGLERLRGRRRGTRASTAATTTSRRSGATADAACEPRAEARLGVVRSAVRTGRTRAVDSRSPAADADPDGRIVSSTRGPSATAGTARGRSAIHTYRRAGSYRVVLRDRPTAAGNRASAARTIRVGKARPGAQAGTLSGAATGAEPAVPTNRGWAMLR